MDMIEVPNFLTSVKVKLGEIDANVQRVQFVGWNVRVAVKLVMVTWKTM